MDALIIVAGFGGGALRGLVGFIKHQYSYKNVKFDIPYFITMVFISGVVGTISAVAIKETGMDFSGAGYLTPSIALIIGYAGGDFLENIYKIIVKRTDLYSK